MLFLGSPVEVRLLIVISSDHYIILFEITQLDDSVIENGRVRLHENIHLL